MIIRINTRANGDQLAEYISTLKDNEHIEILEVDGREAADKQYLKHTILSMELNAELTKCKNPYLNVQINPAYGEDRKMSRKDWYKAADILAEELGYQDQRRVIVLHTKKGRTHAHVVWERYNHDTQTVVPTKNSRLKAKFARVKIEKALGQKPTAWRNVKKPDIKVALTDLWNRTNSATEFIKEAKKAGFVVASGTGNRPYMVVDKDGVSYDLVRQLTDIRTREVRARLRNETLITDKQAIEDIRREQAASSGKRGREQPEARPSPSTQKRDFKENAEQATKSEQQIKAERMEAFMAFDEQAQELVDDKREPIPTPMDNAAQNFAENKVDTLNDVESEQEMLREKMRRQQEEIRNKRKLRGRGR